MRVVEHIGQEEKHYHIAYQVDSSIRKLDITKLHGAHIRVNNGSGGSLQGLIKYINCEDDKHKSEGVTYELIDEFGEPKLRGGKNKNYKKWTVKRLRETEDEEEVPVNYYNMWKKLKTENNNCLDIADYKKNITVVFIYGPSGIGKSEKALELIRDSQHLFGTKFNEVKYSNGFWNGVDNNCKIALYDDFRDSHMTPSEFINFIDYNKHNLNIKGGYIKNNYEFIIITSIQDPNTLYKEFNQKHNNEPKKQWLRRMQLINMNPIINLNEVLGMGTVNSVSNLQENIVRNYEREDECYYCDQNILCACKCIVNNKQCIEKECNLHKF